MKRILAASIMLPLIWSCNEYSVKRKKIGNDWIEAQFINDTIIDGHAKFYNCSGDLVAQCNYRMGKKEGYSVRYYKNGQTKDSVNYSDNLLNGEAFKFDANGKLLYQATNFYGLNMGDHSSYINGKVSEYYFDNFEKKQLVNCRYDSLGRCDSLAFHAIPIITSGLIENKIPAVNFFAYLPHPRF